MGILSELAASTNGRINEISGPLPDGSGFAVMTIPSPYSTRPKRLRHLLFNCQTFWRIRPFYHCSECGKGFRCFWDGNDCCRLTNICRRCFVKNHKDH